MGKRQIFVLLVILAAAFITAEDAPQNAGDSDAEEVELVDGTEPELFEAEVGTADDTIDPADGTIEPEDGTTDPADPDVEDIGLGSPIAQAPESDEGSDQTEVAAAPVPMAAPVPQTAATGGRTKILFEKIVYKWTIVNYRHHAMEHGEVLYSPVFSGENTDEYEWQLQFYPRGDDIKYKTYASLYLASVGKDGAKPNVQFSIIDYRGRNVNIKKFNNQKYTGRSWGFGNFVPFHLIEKAYHKIWVPNDKLTLVAEISFSPGIKNALHCTDLNETDCLAMPYGNNDNYDVHLFFSNDQYIRGQKAALAAHSTWLDEHFRKNSHVNAVRLPADVNADDMREAVRFIYTGEVDSNKAERLKALADQLGMKKLKAMCEEVLCKSQYSNHSQLLLKTSAA